MEQLIQKYIKYFYITVICIITAQLIDVICVMLFGNFSVMAFILMLVSMLNLVLFSNCMKHNINQRFIECKMDLKVLRVTVIPLMICQILFCFSQGFDLIMLMNHIGIVVLVELILTYRIKSLDHLVNLVNQYMKYERKEDE
jgi:hypothetical protein